MGPFLSGFADELIKLGALPGAKATVPMPPVAGGRPDYKASGSFKPKMPKIEAPGAMKMAEAGGVSDKPKLPKPTRPKLSLVTSKPRETPRLGAEFAKLTPSQKKTELAVPGSWTPPKPPSMDSPDPKMPSMTRAEAAWWKKQEAAGNLPSQARASQTEAEWKARHPKPKTVPVPQS